MLVDVILDRQLGYGIDHDEYRAKDLYNYLVKCGDICNYQDVARALDSGKEKDVKRELCRYIDGKYNPKIKDYIRSVSWLQDDMKCENRDKVINKMLDKAEYTKDFLKELKSKCLFEKFLSEYRLATNTKKVIALVEKYLPLVA